MDGGRRPGAHRQRPEVRDIGGEGARGREFELHAARGAPVGGGRRCGVIGHRRAPCVGVRAASGRCRRPGRPRPSPGILYRDGRSGATDGVRGVGRRRGSGAGPFPSTPPHNRARSVARTRLSGRHAVVQVGARHLASLPALLPPAWCPSPCARLSRPPRWVVAPTTTATPPWPWGSRPAGHPAFPQPSTYERDVGASPVPHERSFLPAHPAEGSRRGRFGALSGWPRPRRAAWDVCFYRWRLGFRQSGLHRSARARRVPAVRIFRPLPLPHHAAVPLAFAARSGGRPRSHVPQNVSPVHRGSMTG